MQAITTIGFDIAKSVFQVHGVDAADCAPAVEASPGHSVFPEASAMPGWHRSVRLIALLVARAPSPWSQSATDATSLREALRQATEIIRRGDNGGDRCGEGAHRRIEVSSFVRVLCHIRERILPEDPAEGRLAGLDAMKQLPPSTLGDAAEQQRSGAHRAGHARAQAIAERREREPPLVVFGEDAGGDEKPQDALERLGMGPAELGQFLRIARAVA